MRADHVDLIQLHNPSVEQCEENDLVAVLQEMKAQGKAGWVGISVTEPRRETFIGWGVFDTFQIPYSALERQHEKLIQAASDAGAGVIVRGGVPAASRVPDWETPTVGPPGRTRDWTELLEEGDSATQFLLRFTNAHPGMSTNIVGTRSVEHLRENIAAAANLLSPEIYAEAKRRLDAASTDT